MRVLSLFDGISCGFVALQRAGVKVDRYVASEIDGYAKIVSRNNHGNKIEYVGDVCKLNFEEGEFDLILAGSPCQGFSIAGYGQGFEDDRSKLYFEFLRIKEQVKPKYWLLENVPMRRAWRNRISSDLWKSPIEINSALVSAQIRKRLYWSNIPFTIPQNTNINLQNILIKDFEFLKPYKVKRTASREKMWNGSCPNLTKRNKSNCLTTKQDRWGNAGLIEFEDFCRYLTEVECERLQTLEDNYTFGVPQTERYKLLGNCWTVEVIVHILANLRNV